MSFRPIRFARQFDSNLWILSAGRFVSAVSFALSIPFISIYFIAELGLSITQVGLFFGMMAVIRALFQAIGGEISDRFERRKLMVYAQGIRGIAILMIGVSIATSWGFWPVSVFLVISSIFGAIFHPIANAMVSDILPEEQRLDGYAITRSAANLGWAVGPAMGGFLASESYATLFFIAAIVTMFSAMVFQFFLKSVDYERAQDRFTLKDLVAIKDDSNLAKHSILTFLLFLVVAQLIAPFSIYAVEIVGISEVELGYLFGLNGLIVVLGQIPMTRLLSKTRLTSQLIIGAIIYAVSYSFMGLFSSFWLFFLIIFFVTIGEITMSPSSLTLTSRMAPPGRIGRYMGIYGFVMASGWSFGPLWGGIILDHLGYDSPVLAWISIASLALISAVGYKLFQKTIDPYFDQPKAIE